MVTRKAPAHLLLAVTALCLAGCTYSETETTKSLNPQWTDALSLPSLLEEPVAVSSQSDLKALLASSWYAEVDVRNTANNAVTSLGNCNDYFSNKTPDLRAQRDQEQSAFTELTMACEAVQILTNAQSSSVTFLPDRVLNDSTPQLFPKPIALVTSTSERDTLMADSNKRVWGDVNAIVGSEQVSDHQVRYFSEGGEQLLSEIGRGDTNQDGVEDVLILSQDSVPGGSYTHFRLFVLSVNDRGEWILLEHH